MKNNTESNDETRKRAQGRLASVSDANVASVYDAIIYQHDIPGFTLC